MYRAKFKDLKMRYLSQTFTGEFVRGSSDYVIIMAISNKSKGEICFIGRHPSKL